MADVLTPVEDISLVSAEAVDRRDATDVGWFDGTFQHKRALMKVTFASRTNLYEYTNRFEFNITTRTFMCHDGEHNEARELGGDLKVFGNRGLVDAYIGSLKESLPEYHYRIYIGIRRDAPLGRQTLLYDLRASPQDVCFFIRGGNMIGGTFVSNTIHIPKEAISAAILRPRVH